MLHHDFTTDLIDINDSIIDNVSVSPDFISISLHLKRKTHSCPHCSALTDKIHDYRTQKIKDLPIQGKNVFIIYKKRRYKCPCCGKSFYENFHILPKFHRITNRTALFALDKLKEKRSVKSIAKELNVSSSSIFRWMNYFSCSKSQRLPSLISIDEFKGDSGGEKYNCILTDLSKRKVFDILPSRKQEDILAYFSSFSNRKEVKYVVMDMSHSFKESARLCFPNAKIVIDKFHVARYNIWAFENVRRNIQKRLPNYERKYFKRSRKLLLKRIDELKDEDKIAVEMMLSKSVELKNAYILKEYFYKFMESKSSEEAKERLKWVRRMQGVVQIKEYEKCFGMLRNWEKYIVQSFDYKYTNGFTEGTNNTIKVIKRVGYGYRNFENFRKRIMMILS